MTSREFITILESHIVAMNKDTQKQFDKLEKDLEVLEIIRNKSVDIGYIRLCMNVEEGLCKMYNYSITSSNDELTQEEYDKIKEWLENETH